jgi:hypothetical protein
MISVASRHAASSYQYYSLIYLVPRPMQMSRCVAWHLQIHLYFKDSHLKTLDSRVKFSEKFNSKVKATPNRCTYMVPLFDQLGEKALNDFMPEYLVPELSTQKICHRQERSRSPNTYSLVTHSGAADEDWYPRYHLAWTRKAQGGVCCTTSHGLGRPKERSTMTQCIIQKIPADHDILPKAEIIISIKIYVK